MIIRLSIKNIILQGGEGWNKNGDLERFSKRNFCDKGGGDDFENCSDIIYGWPLTEKAPVTSSTTDSKVGMIVWHSKASQLEIVKRTAKRNANDIFLLIFFCLT